MERKKGSIDFRKDIEKILSPSGKRKAEVPFALVPCACETDVRISDGGRFTGYMCVYSEKEFREAVRKAKECLPAGLRSEAEAVAKKTHEILSVAGLDSDGMVAYIMMEEKQDGSLKIAGKGRNGKHSAKAFPVRLDDAEKLSLADWASVSSAEAGKITEFIEADKAEKFLAGQEKDREDDLPELPERRISPERGPETETVRVLDTAQGPVEGMEADSLSGKMKDAGYSMGSDESFHVVVKKDSESQRISSKPGSPDGKSGTNVPEKKGQRAKRDNVRILKRGRSL